MSMVCSSPAPSTNSSAPFPSAPSSCFPARRAPACMWRVFAGWGGAQARRQKGLVGGSARLFAGAGNLRRAKTNFYPGVGSVAARSAARADGGKLRGPCAAAGGLSSPGGRSLGLDGLSCRENHLVAPLVLVRPERLVPPPPRRINFL